MTDEHELRRTLSELAARQLANATKTVPQMIRDHAALAGLLSALDARGSRHLSCEPRQGGTPVSPRRRAVQPAARPRRDLPETFVDYEEAPREYTLNAVTTVLDVQTRVSDLYNSPYDQIQEQLRLLIELVKERQENELDQQRGLWPAEKRGARGRRQDPHRTRRRRTISTNSSPRCGRSRPSSLPTRGPSQPSDANAPAGRAAADGDASSVRPS